jgi:hypothetical protein
MREAPCNTWLVFTWLLSIGMLLLHWHHKTCNKIYMPNFEKDGTQASWKAFHKRCSHYMLTSLLIAKKWSIEKWTHVFDLEQKAFFSNKTTSGWFIIHSSRKMPKMCYMIRVVHNEQNKWNVLQNEILPWWCNRYSYGMTIKQIFVRRHMEMSDVIHYPNTCNYCLAMPNMFWVTMQKLKMLRGSQKFLMCIVTFFTRFTQCVWTKAMSQLQLTIYEWLLTQYVS